MTLGIKESIRNDGLNLIRDALDAGIGQGKLKIYTDPRPATGAVITTQTLLGTPLFSATSAPNASGGVLTFNSITKESSAVATGIGTWGRGTDSDDNFVTDLKVGKTFSLTGSITTGSAIITGISSDTSTMDVGMLVTGTGIPAGATILSIDSSSQITLDSNATATNASASLTFKTPDADLFMNNNSISLGSEINITSGTLTAGNA